MKKTRDDLNRVAILGLYYTGYGIIRELTKHNIPIFVFDKIVKWPERVTRLAMFNPFETESELLEKLFQFAGKQEKKPVMYLASDYYVDFFKRNRKSLQNLYLIDFPDNYTTETFLEKGAFAKFAEKNNFPIPKTVIFNSYADYERQRREISFPCLLKPFWRTDKWLGANLKKVYYYKTRDELEESLKQIIQIENNLIVQEFIPGGDDLVYFHLMYYDSKSECRGEFTGRKLRQWPPGLGQTACAEPAPRAAEVKNISRALFNHVGYRGFGSVEYRKHPLTGKYYITEPTVGRQDSQSLIAPFNGVNLASIAYTSLTAIELPETVKPRRKVFWIDDQYDLFSIAVSIPKKDFSFKNIARSYAGKKKFRLFNIKDPYVAIYCWTGVIFDKIKNKLKNTLNGPPENG